jgi:hypothetical protein
MAFLSAQWSNVLGRAGPSLRGTRAAEAVDVPERMIDDWHRDSGMEQSPGS